MEANGASDLRGESLRVCCAMARQAKASGQRRESPRGEPGRLVARAGVIDSKLHHVFPRTGKKSYTDYAHAACGVKVLHLRMAGRSLSLRKNTSGPVGWPARWEKRRQEVRLHL